MIPYYTITGSTCAIDALDHEDQDLSILSMKRSALSTAATCFSTDTMVTSHWKGSSFDPEMIWEQAPQDDEEIILTSFTQDDEWCQDEDEQLDDVSSRCSAVEELLLLQQQREEQETRFTALQDREQRLEDDENDTDDAWSTMALAGSDSPFGVTSSIPIAEFERDAPQQESTPQQDILGRTFEMPSIVVEDEDGAYDDSDSSTCSSVSTSSFYSAVSSTTSASLALGTFEDAEEEEEPHHASVVAQSTTSNTALNSIEAEIESALAQLRQKQASKKESSSVVKSPTLSSRRHPNLCNNAKLNMMNYRFMSLFGAVMLCSSVVC